MTVLIARLGNISITLTILHSLDPWIVGMGTDFAAGASLSETDLDAMMLVHPRLE